MKENFKTLNIYKNYEVNVVICSIQSKFRVVNGFVFMSVTNGIDDVNISPLLYRVVYLFNIKIYLGNLLLP